MLPRTVASSLSVFFESELKPNIVTPIFYNNAIEDRFFSFVSFSAFVDQAFYSSNQITLELSTWSIYDWIHSGVPMYEMNDNNKTKRLTYIVFKKHHGRYKILYKDEAPGREIHYRSGKDSILWGTGNKKTITEGDLINIFPSSVKRLIFK
jgi:hypothetical protein